MSAKDLIDGIRRDYSVPLPLNRSRDMISRLLYGAPYSAAIAAEHAGKLAAPGVDPERTDALVAEHGPWVTLVVEISSRHIKTAPGTFACLRESDLIEIALLSAARDEVEKPDDYSLADWITAPSGSPMDDVKKLRRQLQERIAQLDTLAINELTALVWLGRGEEGSYDSLLAYAKTNVDSNPSSYLAAKTPLHQYLANGLRELGNSGWDILLNCPQMLSWLSPGKPSLHELAKLEMALAGLCAEADLPHPPEAYARYVAKALDTTDDLDYFGSDEQMPYLTDGYKARQNAVVCIYGDLEIGKAYYFAGKHESAAKRIQHATTFLTSLARTLKEGPRPNTPSAAGGNGKAKKFDPLRRKFEDLLREKRPQGGWGSMASTAARLLDSMQAVNNALEPRPAVSEQMESTLRTWLSKDPLIKAAYRGD